MIETLQLDGINFVLDNRPGSQRAKSEDEKFVLVKTKGYLSFYDSLVDDPPKSILEIGMFEGGSLVYFDKLFSPKVLVGIDIRRDPIPALEKYKIGRPHIKTFYGRSQDQLGARNAAQASFPKGIDMVVDDASHLYDETKKTFENIFPLVKPGGRYVIEDWAWAHGAQSQGPDAVWHSKPAVTNFLFELTVMTAVSRVLESVTITQNLVCIKKGKGMLPKSMFDFSAHLRGKELPRV